MNSKMIMGGSIVFGVAFLGLTALYWLTPAGNLPTYVPGYIAGSSDIHFKHGLASLILAVGLFIVAWFKSAPKEISSGETEK